MLYSNDNPFIPKLGRIINIVNETRDIKTFTIELINQEMEFYPGQFVMITVFGYGEAPFAIASKPGKTRIIEISVRSVGDVSNALHKLGIGSVVGVRGPLGRGFPLNELEDRDIVVIAGGTGLLGVSSLLWYAYFNKDMFNNIYLFYGARTPRDIIKKNDINEWRKKFHVYLSVDRTDGLPWDGYVGFVTDFIDLVEVPRESLYIICGPPMMMKVAYKKLVNKGVDLAHIYVSLERHMKCGIGKCGRCLLSNGLYVCKDGPIFRCDILPEREIE
ncbi:MAG TPA: hypothetical protein ENF93_02245 [Ignisphaera sp.]|nr:hypothetical protein [Ignisphaera sp.]